MARARISRSVKVSKLRMFSMYPESRAAGSRCGAVVASRQMALADLTKQLAQQAILSATSGPKSEPAAAPAPAPDAGPVFLAQIQAMQKAIKEDEELVVTWTGGADRIRVMEIFLPSPGVVVLSGVDGNRQTARVVSALEALQVLCRVVKAAPGARPLRVGLVIAKPKDTPR